APNTPKNAPLPAVTGALSFRIVEANAQVGAAVPLPVAAPRQYIEAKEITLYKAGKDTPNRLEVRVTRSAAALAPPIVTPPALRVELDLSHLGALDPASGKEGKLSGYLPEGKAGLDLEAKNLRFTGLSKDKSTPGGYVSL